ncbi:hypothetical protein [Bradyrhizobium niftali]|uniref:O-antigen ligase family protein n=1 Tax=Bradyrhizobium niftali TaxID=2560055 RepID=A0A4Y9LD70_9BRAD|nr:hypothetical protein [Bradyrhizobium niftali]TFV41348.1 hypothetical protein E4K65_36245 [Bradyrhizobium niftali]
MGLKSIRAALLGVLVSAGSLAVLAHGLLGAGSLVTGVLFAGPVVLLVVLGEWRGLSPNICDGLFGLFVLSAGASMLVNGFGGDVKEAALFAITLGSYAAGRLMGPDDIRTGVITVGSITVAAGTLATLIALIEQWSWRHGKPLVFGEFDAAPAQFAMLLGLVVLAVPTSVCSSRRLIAIIVVAAVPAAIFAASMVRFTFIALALGLAVEAMLGPRLLNHKAATGLAAVVLCAILAALALRWQTTRTFVDHSWNAAGAWSIPCEAVDHDNSIEIRQQLYLDALRMLPAGGPFGIGLDGFTVRGCIKGVGVHNTFLQAALEFGWVAGAALIMLVLCAWRDLRPIARISAEYRFIAAALVFVATVSMMHGRISRECALFVLLGYAARLRGLAMETAAKRMLRPVGFERPADCSSRSG